MELPKNSETASISLPSWLLSMVDTYCTEKGINRSAFFQKAGREYLLREMDALKTWERFYRSENGESC
jgi:metal-responsive CopG/Arc/MetJ family transcriptional regulator